MGNANTRYLTNAETVDILGGVERWSALKLTFEKIAGKSMDFRLFCNIIQRRFQNIPKVLLETLFQAFAVDLTRRVDIENFLSTFAVIDSFGSGPSNARPTPNAQLVSLQRKCLFRIYEAHSPESGGAGTLQRRRVEDILRLAYGEALKPVYKDLQRQLDGIFSRYQATEITLKEFESSNPQLEMLSGWVRTVVRCFDTNDVSHTRLYALECKHSAQLDDAQLFDQYGLNPEVCSDLRKVFTELCASSVNIEATDVELSEGAGEETQNLSVRAELQYSAWLSLLAGGESSISPATISNNADPTNNATAAPGDIIFLNPVLARVIFHFKVDDFKLKWHYKDFASFCAVFGGTDVELQASTVVDAFLHDALTYYYNGIGAGDTEADTSGSSAVEGNISSGGNIYDIDDSGSTSSSDVDESSLSPFSLLSPNSDTTTTVPANVKSIVEQTVDEYILQALNQMITVLATPATHYSTTTATTAVTPSAAVVLHPSLVTVLHHINSTITPEHYSLAFTDLIIAHISHLPGMRDLMLCACCKFGFNPASPLKEMELCTELSLRYLHKFPQSVQHPYGPVGTQWCVVPKGWYDNWKLYVGHQHHFNTHTPISTNNSASKRYITNTSQFAASHNHIPASIAGSVLDLDGITPFSPPSPTISQRSSAFYGSSNSRHNTTPSASSTHTNSHNNTNKPTTMRRGPSPNRPLAMDTTVLLKKQTYFLGTAHTVIGSKQGQLLPNLVCGKDIEIVSPDVYKALISWYGGGPRINRTVVAVVNSGKLGSPSAIPSRSNTAYKGKSTPPTATAGVRKTITADSSGITTAATSMTINTNASASEVQTQPSSVVSPRVVPYPTSSALNDTLLGTSELELYPLCINIHTCNNSGKLLPTPLISHLLFSKTATVHDVCVFLSATHELELPRLRLWNYFHSKADQWREQYVLSPELTLGNANIMDHQVLLLEVSLLDGSWPRSILQSQLDNESSNIGTSAASASDKTAANASGGSAAVPGGVSKINIDDYAVYIDEYLGTTHSHSDNSGTTTDSANYSSGMPNYDPTISNSIESIGDSIVSTIENAASTLQSILVSEVSSVLGAPLPSQNKAISSLTTTTTSAPSTTTAPSKHTAANEHTKPTNTTLTTRQAIKAIRRNSGLVGLDNLGNTCYLNSSLQALLHTQPLVDYFLSQAYTRHINTTSIHGFKGQLAKAFGQLVCDTYSTANKSIVPRNFCNSIAAMHDQFAGHEQHDAQELLAFLLDGLSEDLNLVHTKPYTEQPDSDHRSDAVLADIWWSNHLKRDKSVIQAMFSGQFKSTMKCTHCTYTSARYEPFNFISVPVPEESDRLLTVTVVPFDVAHSAMVSVKVSKNGTLHDVVQAILALGMVGLKGVYVGGEVSPTESVASEGGRSNNTNKGDTKSDTKHHKHKKHNHTTITTDNSNNGNTTPYYFQAGELVNHRIKSFNTLERPINNIRDSDGVVLFQVREMYGIATVNSSSSNNNNMSGESTGPVSGEKSDPTTTSAKPEIDVDVDAATLHNTRVNASSKVSMKPIPPPILKPSRSLAQGKENTIFDPESLYHANYSDRDQWVRVAFTQRRARMHDAALYKNAVNNNNNAEYSIMGNGLFGNTFTAVATSPNPNPNPNSATNMGTPGNSAGDSNSALNKGQRANGTEYFKLEAFGIAGLEVLPNKIRCGDLYRLVALKYASYLKVPVKELIARRRKQRESQKQALKHTCSSQSLNSINSSSGVTSGGYNNTNNKQLQLSLGSDPNEDYPVNVRSTQVGSADSDEVMGGAIPEYGFTLRLVNGGVSLSSTCSRCPWLKKCDGCVLPDHSEVEVELRDGESVAVDWHFEVYETILDTTAMCKVKKHSSGNNSSNSGSNGEGLNVCTPLARCFDKFTELEPLDDIVCPTCHNTSLSKAFTLWRLPPVLIVQLKRFRFDRTSRRKLNNQIDFPMENLDLFDYLAPGRQRALSRSRAATLDATTNDICPNGSTTLVLEESDVAMKTASAELARTALYGDTDNPDPDNSLLTHNNANTTIAVERDEMLCTRYDLYSVVHHAGALGGGHYATTARALNMHMPKNKNISDNNNDTTRTTNASVSEKEKEKEEQWYCFNDNLVSTIDASEICAPSAYLLFYMRKDMRQGDVLSLLRRQLSDPVIHTETPQIKENVFRSVSSDIADPKAPITNKQMHNNDEESVHSGDTAASDDDEQLVIVEGQEQEASSSSHILTTHRDMQSSEPHVSVHYTSTESGVISPEQVTVRTTPVPITNTATPGGVIKTSANNGFSGFTDGEEEMDIPSSRQADKKASSATARTPTATNRNTNNNGSGATKEEGDCVVS